jgi:hypothetical protein
MLLEFPDAFRIVFFLIADYQVRLQVPDHVQMKILGAAYYGFTFYLLPRMDAEFGDTHDPFLQGQVKQ